MGAFAALFMGLTLSGCNYIVMLGYLIGGPPSIEPAFDAETKESLTDKGIKVAVICFAPKEVRHSFEQIDTELSKFVAMRLNQHKVKIVNPDMLGIWLEQHKDWDRPEEIGEAFDADYVVYLDLNQFSLYEEGSATLYRGKAEAIVSVWKIDEDREGSEKIFSKEVISKYPLHQPVATSDKPYLTFKGQYLARLSEEIGRMFYEHYAGDDISDG